MKKIGLFACIVILSSSVFSQEVSEEVLVVNIEVPVRVFKGTTFVDNLSINDFEVFEEGISQKVEAVYLVKKRTIERSEEKKEFAPKTSRNFYLFFEISEYTGKLGNALSYFVKNVLFPGDNLTVVTPRKTYRMKSKTLEILPKEKIINDFRGIVRTDAYVGNLEYKETFEEIASLARSLTTTLSSAAAGASKSGDEFSAFGDSFSDMSVEVQISLYRDLLQKLEHLRKVDQSKLLDFAKFLKDKEGQKYIFMFYQREFIPQVDPAILNQAMEQYQGRPEVLQKISDLVHLYKREIAFDVDLVKQAYADSSISIHFLFIARPVKRVFGVYMEEHSEDIYAAFREMASATGGISDSSANPVSLCQKAVEAAENYYLLYYSPQNYKKDGKFKEIKVRTKNKDYNVLHRAGYFAN